MADEKRWTYERKKLLIATRLRHEVDFSAKNKRRNTVWETILKEIKHVDQTFPFSRDEITRCFLNIMGTYKRIKRRNTSGEAASSWEFFDEIDKVFRNRCNIQVPKEITESSFEQVFYESAESTDTEQEDAVFSPTTSMKRKRNEVLDFLKRESAKDEEIFNKILKIETEKLKIEKEKVTELKQLRVLFERIAKQSSNK